MKYGFERWSRRKNAHVAHCWEVEHQQNRPRNTRKLTRASGTRGISNSSIVHDLHSRPQSSVSHLKKIVALSDMYREHTSSHQSCLRRISTDLYQGNTRTKPILRSQKRGPRCDTRCKLRPKSSECDVSWESPLTRLRLQHQMKHW